MNLQEALDWIAGVFGEPAGQLTATTASSEIAGWDSLGTLMLLAELDEKFSLHIDEAEIYGLKGVGDILALLERAGVLVVAAH